MIVQAADRLRELAALDIGSTRSGESPSARRDRMWATVELELSRLREFARIATVAEWRSARVPSAVVEISVRAGEAHRESLFGYVKDLVAVAPNAQCRRAMVRASLRVLEPLVESAGAAPRWGPVVEGHLMELESAGLDGPFVAHYRRRLQALRVGTSLPRFVARDIAGNELRSAQLEGRIVVFRFWDPSSAASVAAHEEDSRLVRRFWDAPFDLVGISASSRRAEHLSFIERARFGGTQLFDGPISNELADELAKDAGRFVRADGFDSPFNASSPWGKPAHGALVVVDELGVIRGRDLTCHEVESLVVTLVAERRARLREQQLAPTDSL